MKQKSYRRGYPVAMLIGIEQDHASLWQVFSQIAKHQQTINIDGERKDRKTLYNYHETIVNSLRSTIKEGVRSIIVAVPSKASYGQDFLTHISEHHSWLLQGPSKVSLSQIFGSADTPSQVAELAKTNAFKQLIQENAEEETNNLLNLIEKRLNMSGNLVFFSIEEAEKVIFENQNVGKPQPDYLLLTDRYLSSSRQKNRINKLMQIAKNKNIKTRVIKAESNAGLRLTQLGGLICLMKN
jgi:stalled ribosome rescue protein Dom34